MTIAVLIKFDARPAALEARRNGGDPLAAVQPEGVRPTASNMEH
jgi:hypothetical protein